MQYRPPPTQVYDFTTLPLAPDQNADPDLLLEIHEHVSYLTDLVESALQLGYLINPNKPS